MLTGTTINAGSITYTYSVTIPWSQLVALGLTTANTFTIAVRATNSQGSTDANSSLAIGYTVPTISPNNGATTVNLGQPYTIQLSETQFGSEPILGWLVNWGDGRQTLSKRSAAPPPWQPTPTRNQARITSPFRSSTPREMNP